MRKIVLILTLLALLTLRVSAQELLEQEAEILGTQTLEDGLDGEARSMLDGVSPSGTADFGKELTRMLGRAVSGLETPLHAALRTGCMLLAVVLLKVFLVPGLPCGHTLFAAGTGAFLLCTGLELPQTLFEAARGMLVLPDLLTGIGIGLFGLCGLVCAWQACGEETE